MKKFHSMNLEKIQKCSNKELEEIILYTDKVRCQDFRLECLYWMCILEVNIRADEDVEYTWIRCVTNISNKEGNVLFQYGKDYMVFVVGTILIVLTESLFPYIFSAREEDQRCIWKYFTESGFKNIYLM